VYAQKGEKMYARVFVSQIKKPEMIEAHLQVIKNIESVMELQYPDLRDVFHLVDRDTGKVIDIFFWETEDAANNLRIEEMDGTLKEQFVKGMDFLTTPPVDELYEVLL
jgi:hypothetical protein